MSEIKTSQVNLDIDALKTMDRLQLGEKWQTIFRRPPPKNASQEFMVLALAYKLQEAAFGELRPALSRRLRQSGEDSPTPATTTKPGTTLIREWRGITYVVTILDKGVQMNGRLYGSLTEVARQITGTHQSGPIFFGLRKYGSGK